MSTPQPLRRSQRLRTKKRDKGKEKLTPQQEEEEEEKAQEERRKQQQQQLEEVDSARAEELLGPAAVLAPSEARRVESKAGNVLRWFQFFTLMAAVVLSLCLVGAVLVSLLRNDGHVNSIGFAEANSTIGVIANLLADLGKDAREAVVYILHSGWWGYNFLWDAGTATISYGDAAIAL